VILTQFLPVIVKPLVRPCTITFARGAAVKTTGALEVPDLETRTFSA
jgi:hypothetical protein